MSDDVEHKQHESNAASPEHGTPTRPASSGWTAAKVSDMPETGRAVAMNMSPNGSFVEETEAVQPNEMLLDDDIVDVTEATGDISEDHHFSSKPRHLQDVDDYIATEGLTVTLDQFPDSAECTFAVSDDKGYFDDRKLLFLGGTESFQAWARLKIYSSKPDEVDFVHYSFLAHQARPAHDLSRLPISMYPFRLLTENKVKLTVLVRYVSSLVAGVDRSFSTEAKGALKSALVDIGEAIEKTVGGVDKMLDIHPPSKLPKGFSYMENGPSAKTDESVHVSDQSDQEVEMYQLLDIPSTSQIFEVPIKTKLKKTTKPRAIPKPKAPPRAVAAETSPIQDPVIAVKASSIESDEEPTEPKFRRIARPKYEPKPKTKLMPAPKKTAPAKRRADQAGLDEEAGYAQLEDLEVERNEIEQGQAGILKR